MNIYSVNMFGGLVGYVCTEDRKQATIKIANLLGFQNLEDYVSEYPGCFTNLSKVRAVVQDTPTYKTRYGPAFHVGDNFVLAIDIIDGQSCVIDLQQSAKDIYDYHYSWWYNRTLAIPKMHELKQSDKYFSDVEERYMWYCEDWDEGTTLNAHSVDMLGKRVGYVCAKNDIEATTKAANMLGFLDLNEYADNYPDRFSLNSKILNIVCTQGARKHWENIFSNENIKCLLDVRDISGQSWTDDLSMDVQKCCDPDPTLTFIVPKIAEVRQCYLPREWNEWKFCLWYCEDLKKR